MNITSIAKLAQIKLSQEEAVQLESQLVEVLKYFAAIKEVPVQNVEPMVTPTPMELVLRRDQAELWLERDLALANAKETVGNLFKVPPVI